MSRLRAPRLRRVCGFLPAAATLLVWACSLCTQTLVQGWGAQPPRAAATEGVLMINWHSSGAHRGFGAVEWSLGYVTHPETGAYRPGLWFHSYFPDVSAQWDVELRGGHVKVPLIYLAAAAAVPPVLFGLLRRRPAPSECGSCGYDVSGLEPNAPCPECGSTSSETR